MSLATLAAHGGTPRPIADESTSGRPHIAPLVQSSVYDFATVSASVPALAGQGGYVYARNGMPNADELGAAVAALEGADAGTATSSGMAAIAAVVLAGCGAGDRVVVQRDAYGGTIALLEQDLARFGVEVRRVNAYDARAVAAAADGARLVLVESISNPLLLRVDVEAVVAACRARGATLVVDNTFATPLAVRPLELGADVVIHSVTKFLGGHHDLCAGAVVGDAATVDAVRGVARRMGLGAAPLDAWLAVRGIRTLEVRMERACASAAELADRLRRHDSVKAVYATEQCALVTFDVGSLALADRVVERAKLITLTPSLGGTTTTFSHPATSSHRALSAEERAEAGIGDGLLRLSLGLEHVDDLWRDLEHALG